MILSKIIYQLLFIFLIFTPILAYGQSLSELDKQLKEQNEQRAEEIEASQQLQQGSFAKVDCPQGTHERAKSGGGIVCVDDVTGKEVNPSDYWSYQLGGEGSTLAIGIGIAILILAILIGIAKSRLRRSSIQQQSSGPITVPRKEFVPETKERVKENQNGRCKKCGKIPTHWSFHHKGRRDDNSIHNCMGLCLDCHEDYTRTQSKDHHSTI